jgi:hypothetical protein
MRSNIKSEMVIPNRMKRGLFFFFGEAFREYNPLSITGISSLSRIRDTEYGVEKQRESSISHVKLASHLSSHNYNIDFALHTYHTQHHEMLQGLYPNVVYARFTEPNPSIVPITNTVVQTALQSLLSSVDIDKYSFIFLCRFDLLLKDSLIQLFNPEWNTITYPNVMSIANDTLDLTCISDLFVFIPCRFFTSFASWKGLYHNANFVLHHYCIQDLVACGLCLRDDISFMTDACYIANTIQMKNPLYAINCRPEGPELHEWNKMRYDKDTHTCIYIE